MKLLEKFITMQRVDTSFYGNILVSLYINPTADEMREIIPHDARGFVSSTGDIYLEGYEKDVEDRSSDRLIHYDLIQFIQMALPKVHISDDNESRITKDGFTVQRYGMTDTFYIAESILYSDINNKTKIIENTMKAFAIKNPKLLLKPISICRVKEEESTIRPSKEYIMKSLKEDTMTQTGTMFNRTMTGAEGMDGATSIAQPDAAQRSKDLQTRLQTSAAAQGVRDPQMINQAWDLAKQKADQSLMQGSKDPNYWDYVNASAATSLGVDSSQRTESLASIPGYVSFEEEVERVEHQGSGKRDKDLAAKTKEEAAKELIKKLKKSDASLNAIVHSVMNRYAVDIATAMEWCKAKPEDTKHSSKSDPLDFSEGATTDTSVVAPDVTDPIENAELQEKKLNEDNFYNHARVQRQQTEFDYSAISTRDAFEWEMSSTNLRARAIIIDRNFSFEVVIKTMTEYMPRWPHIFDSLKKVGINSVLQISINQLNAASNQLRVTPDDCDINSSSYDAVLKTMDSVMKSYRKIWGDSHYQVCIISTKNPDKMLFLGKLVDVLQKSIGLKFNEKLSSILAEAVLAQPGSADQKVYLVLANPKGAKFKEHIEVDEETSSDAFSAAPENMIRLVSLLPRDNDLPFSKGATGDEITKQSKKHLDAMTSSGFGAQLENKRSFSSLIDLVEKTKISKDYSKFIQNAEKYSSDDFNEIKILYRGDPDFIEMLAHIAQSGQPGHSFVIKVDPDSKEYEKTFGFDGDGYDYIKSISIDDIIPNKKNKSKAAMKEGHRMYYLRCPDGHIEAFDSLEKRDRYKAQVDGKTAKAYDFFNDLTDNSTIFGAKDKVDMKGVKTPVVALSTKESARKLKESKFRWYDISDIEADELFSEFKNSYEKSTGAAWDRDFFESRARGWDFYGSVKGGVAVRPQQSGLLKLNACYGDLRNIILGFNELVTQNSGVGIWGFVTADILKHIVRMSKGEFKQLPAPIAKLMIPRIAPKLGAEVNSVNADGSIQVDTVAGPMTKYFVGNKDYYRWLLSMAENPEYANQFPVPQAVIKPVLHIIKALI